MTHAIHFKAETHDIRVEYLDLGHPQLHLRINEQDFTFSGDDIQRAETDMGNIVTVRIEYHPDAQSQVVALVLPGIDLQQDEEPLSMLLIESMRWSSFEGASGVSGPVNTNYRVHQLEATARKHSAGVQ